MQDMTSIFKILHVLEKISKGLSLTIKKKINLNPTNEYSGGRIKNEALLQVTNTLSMELLAIGCWLFHKLKKLQQVIKQMNEKKKKNPQALLICEFNKCKRDTWKRLKGRREN